MQATALRRMSSMGQAQLQSKSKSLAPPDTGSGLCPQQASLAVTRAVTALVTDTVERGLACSVCFTHASAQVVSSPTPSILASLIRSH